MSNLLIGATLREALDHPDEILPAVPLASSEVDEFPDLTEHGTPLGCTRHRDPATTGEIEQTLVSEDVHGTQNCVLVHPQDSSDVLHQGQTFSGSRFAFGNGPADLGRHLVVEGNRFGSVDIDREHGPSHSSPRT
jgi:hypothetical protein